MDDPAPVPTLPARIGRAEPSREIDVGRWDLRCAAGRCPAAATRVTAVIKRSLDRLDQQIIALSDGSAHGGRGRRASRIDRGFAIE
jgi:hypothetical protein